MKRLCTILLVSIACFGSCVAARAADKPNLVFIIADDCTWRDIGCYGGQAHTPNIDKLAAQGIRMTHCFQAAPMCSPTRHNIYTGLYPVKIGAYPNHTFASKGTKSIVHYLKPLGYRVALSGKRHISPPEVFPFEYSNSRNNPDMQAIEKLLAESKKDHTPFCLFACSNEPHSPWNKGDPSRYVPGKLKLPPNWIDTSETRRGYAKYLAEITYFDDQVGRILALLERYDLQGHTMVMVVSEQGSSFPFAKWTLYDSGIQSAMVVRWPGKIKPGTVSDAMVEYVDVCPTFVEAAGGAPSSVLDGRSILPVLSGKSNTHKTYVYSIQTTKGIDNWIDPYPIRAIRSNQYKLIWNLAPQNTFHNGCVSKDYFASWKRAATAGNEKAKRLAHNYQHRPEFELYDLTEDPYEMINRAGDPKCASVVEDLKVRLDEWMDRQGDEGLATENKATQRQWKNVRKQQRNKR